MRKAWIKNGYVQDICPAEFDPVYAYGEEIGANYVTDVPDNVSNGWTFDGTNFAPPPEFVIEQIVATIEPTKEQLLTELQILTAKINALS